MSEKAPVAVRLGVLTVSDTRTFETDKSGQVVADLATGAGHQVVRREIVTDDVDEIRAVMARWIVDPEVQVVIATGGTGITARDVTPEALAPLVTKPIPGFGELFRWLSFDEIGTSTIQSRAEAGLCGDTVVFVLPGSPGACRTAMTRIILPQLDGRQKPCNLVELMPRFKA
jgi:molybdenum cofactor biosynthesis protein B